MAEMMAGYNPATRTVRVVPANVGVGGAFINIGTFQHPDPVYPGSTVTYHAVRDLLYKRKASNPAQTAMFPDNITDMDRIKIEDNT